MPLNNQDRERLREKFIEQEFKHWSSKLSEFIRLPDSTEREIADYWLKVIEEREENIHWLCGPGTFN